MVWADLSRIILTGGWAGFTGSVGSSTFGLVSLEKFLIPRIIPRRLGLPPGRSGSSSDPSILKILVISPGDREPSGMPLIQPRDSVILPNAPPLSSGGELDRSS